MSNLKTERGTVLYVNVVFDGPTGNGQTLTIPVFNLLIAGLKPTQFMIDNSGDVPFGNMIADMNNATLTSCTLVISYPDATFATTPSIPFGTIIVAAWSDTLINAFGPPADPDWHNNPAYITMSQQLSISAGGTWSKAIPSPVVAAAAAGSAHASGKAGTKKQKSR